LPLSIFLFHLFKENIWWRLILVNDFSLGVFSYSGGGGGGDSSDGGGGGRDEESKRFLITSK
jgi:hypothetical protein